MTSSLDDRQNNSVSHYRPVVRGADFTRGAVSATTYQWLEALISLDDRQTIVSATTDQWLKALTSLNDQFTR